MSNSVRKIPEMNVTALTGIINDWLWERAQYVFLVIFAIVIAATMFFVYSYHIAVTTMVRETGALIEIFTKEGLI